MENTPENKIYSAGYAETFHGADDFSSEFSSFYEKEPDGEVGSSNLYVLSSGTRNTALPEVSARFTAKKILYEFFHAYDFVDANRLAVAMRTANNEICEYARVQNDKMSASAIAAAVTEGKATIATVGGCRAYIIRNGKVFQITEDPAVIEEKVQSGEMTADEAYGSEGGPSLLGTARDITTDIYDGIEVRSGDILLLCSGSLDTFIGKNEIMEAAADNSPRTIVQHLLGSPALQNANVPASAAAIRIYDSTTVDTMIRVDGTVPEDTDLNTEKKEIELIRKNRPRNPGSTAGGKKKDKLPGIILGILAALLLLCGGIYAAARYGLIPDQIREKYLGNLVPSTATPTPTIDWVRESMTVLEATLEAEKEAAVAETVQAWPTQTPYPTFTPVFIDLEEIRATLEIPTETPVPAEDTESSSGTGSSTAAEPDITETEEAVVKDNYTDERSGAEMLYIPAGTFLLGSDLSVDEYAIEGEETPQMRVYLDGYWMNKTEVTNAQYLRCVEAGYCSAGGYMSLYVQGYEDRPVTYVTSDQAARYCSWIGGRLPTEFEWEKAARGTDGRIYPWGSEEPSFDNALANIPNYADEDGEGYDLFPVGSFPEGASPYGLMDMAGNAWEWTSTWYSENYYETLAEEAELNGTVVRNPQGPEFGTLEVMRGGSCNQTEINSYLSFMRAASRSYLGMSSSYYVGFRCLVPDSGESETAGAGANVPDQNGGPQQPEGPGPQEPGPRP